MRHSLSLFVCYRGISLMYEVCFVFEYCLVSSSNTMFPSSFAQWNETLYVDTLGTSVSTVLGSLYEYVRSYNVAYTRIRGILFSELTRGVDGWDRGFTNRYRWQATRPTVYTPLDAANGKMYNASVSFPNNPVLPLSTALRLRLVLSPPISGRQMFKYIRSLPCQYNRDLRYSLARAHLPFFALDSETLATYNSLHKASLTDSSVLNSGSFHIVALGKRNGSLWSSRVIGYESPHLTTTSRSFTFERYV